MIDTAELGLLRLVAQRIAGPPHDTAGAAVQSMVAMQGQDYPGVVTAIALRTAARNRDGVYAAFDSGHVVRSWPMRGTLHAVMAEDLQWMLELTTPRLIRGAASRRALLDIDEPLIERARELAVNALSGGRRLRREDLVAIWEQAGLLVPKQRSYHLFWHLAQTGTLCYGPTIDEHGKRREQCVVLVDDWITAPRRLDHDESLGEWALRYFRSHGPATIKDFAWWTKLTSGEVKAAMFVAGPQLERLVTGGVEYFLDPATPSRLDTWRREVGQPLLLPGFDEFVLGYQDRTAVVPAAFAARIVPGGNGVFLPTVVSGGVVVGTWKRTTTGRRVAVATPFTTFSPALTDAVQPLFDALP